MKENKWCTSKPKARLTNVGRNLFSQGLHMPSEKASGLEKKEEKEKKISRGGRERKKSSWGVNYLEIHVLCKA